MELALVSTMHSIEEIQEAVPRRNVFKNLPYELVMFEKRTEAKMAEN
jgi:hypothetical protein